MKAEFDANAVLLSQVSSCRAYFSHKSYFHKECSIALAFYATTAFDSTASAHPAILYCHLANEIVYAHLNFIKTIIKLQLFSL